MTAGDRQALLVDFIVSLDGYGTSTGWPGWWGLEGPEYLAWLEQQPESESTLLMGANTYREMSGMAAQVQEADAAPEEKASLDGLAAAQKIVFSSTMRDEPAWPNTQVIAEDAAQAVLALKRTASAPLRTIGSISLCRSLLAAGVVDRFRLVVFPVITGRTGRDRIFDAYPDVALELVESRTFDGRLQLLEYVPTVIDGPPGSSSD